ncbi:DinB family protein [Phycicoccus mangrovi]|uniref:DinB family protein n=1 Tax=Phycicoccus mangrovi TaxID=2840470 RepID=UPI0027E2BA96|nr:DinB family protein [Phycicoccus mangrovi]
MTSSESPDTSTEHDEPPARFADEDLRGARFVRCDLSGAVLRAVDVAGAEIDAPWLLEGTLDASVDGEWSFAETVRHLVMATDTWVRGAVLGVERPWHPLGMPNAEYAADGHDPSVFAPGTPTWSEVLAVRADRTALVRGLLAETTADELDATRANPWAPRYPETVRSCLHTVLEEEWEHLRYALRDLDVLDGRGEERGSAG